MVGFDHSSAAVQRTTDLNQYSMRAAKGSFALDGLLIAAAKFTQTNCLLVFPLLLISRYEEDQLEDAGC